MSKTAGSLTIKQLRDLRASMTWGDQRHAMKEARGEAGEPDPTEVAVYAMHRAAQRLGLANGEDIDAFLDRIKVNDLTEVLTENRDPTSPPSQT